MRRLQRLARSTRGAALIAVAVMLAALAGIAIIAVDLSRLLVARAELQNAADAGALAGARLFLDSPIPSDSEVHAHAAEVAGMNEAFAEEGSELIPLENIETFVDSDPAEQTVTVVTRSVVSQYFTGLVEFYQNLAPGTDVQAMNARESVVMARAVAKVGQLCDAKCLKPWSIPDRHDDAHVFVDPNHGSWRNNGKWDGEDFNDANDNGLWDPGETYTDDNSNGTYDSEFYHPLLTGYKASTDHGLQLRLKAGDPNGTGVSSQYYPIDLPDENGDRVTGADWYRENIATCNEATVGPGDLLWTENGRMPGPTAQGMRRLIEQDPNAHWDDGCECIEGSDPQFELSPRIGLIPIHDPRIPMEPGKQTIHVTKLAAFFIEDIQGNGDVVGRFMKILQVGGEFCPPGEDPGGWLWALMLYE